MSDKIIANKELGQNFLIDKNILQNIINLIPDIENRNILEIGGGTGNLSNAIIKKNPAHFTIIEKDPDLHKLLSNLIQNQPCPINLIKGDALKFKLKNILPLNSSNKLTIIANLPYNIATQLLINFLYEIECIDTMILMFQKEVVDRIVAESGSKKFGRLSIISQYSAYCTKEFDVSPNCFHPKPKIISSIVRITPKPNLPINFQENLSLLERTSSILFSQRRKQLQTILKSHQINISFLSDLNIDSKIRPEKLTIAQITLISEYLKSINFFKNR